MAQKNQKNHEKLSEHLNNHQKILELVLAFLRGTLFRHFVGLWRLFAELPIFCDLGGRVLGTVPFPSHEEAWWRHDFQ